MLRGSWKDAPTYPDAARKSSNLLATAASSTGSTAFVVVASFLFVCLLSSCANATPLPSSPELPQRTWTQSSCLNLYGRKPHPNTLPLTKWCFDSAHLITSQIDQGTLGTVMNPWPAALEERQSTDEFLQAVHVSPSANKTKTCVTYQANKWWEQVGTQRKSFSEPLRATKAYTTTRVLLDEVKRVIYVVNLKVASSTISTLMLEGKLGDGKHNVINLCARLNRRNGTLQRIEESVCGGPCKHAFTCSGGTGPFTGRTAQMVTTDLPDEILDDYLVFSFVRDPFTRAEASFHQAAYNAHHYFAEHLRGKQGSTNVHYRGQAYQLLASPSASGRPIVPHFLGRLEDFEHDWARLSVALTRGAEKLPLAERIAMIPPPRPLWQNRSNPKNEGVSSQRRLQEHLAHVRQGAKHDKRYQPVYQPKTHRTSSATSTKEEAKENSKLPFTVEQELEVCRRYLQDLICFDYGIPQNCIKHAAVVI